MKKQKTPKAKRNLGPMLVCMVLDETGSMETCREATISSVNEYVAGLKAQAKDREVLFSLTLFNSEKCEERYSAKPVAEFVDITRATYVPAASTPLYDAMGRSIRSTEKAVADAKEKPNQILFVVQTDGYENASREFTQDQIKKMIEAHKTDWTFVFLGANMDAWAMAQKIGGQVFAQNAMSYAGTPQGTAVAMASLRASTKAYGNSGQQVSTSFWNKQN